MRTLLSLILVQLAIVFLLCVTVHGQQTIEDKRITIHMQRAAFGKVIETLIEDYDVAIGFEQASNMDAEAVWDFNFEPNVRHQLEIPGQVLSPAPLEFHVKKHWITVNFDEEKLSAVLDSIEVV